VRVSRTSDSASRRSLSNPPRLIACPACVMEARRIGPLNDQSFRELELEGAFVAITISAVSIPLHVPLVTDHSTAGLEVRCVFQRVAAI
jgi:hypothetical protein